MDCVDVSHSKELSLLAAFFIVSSRYSLSLIKTIVHEMWLFYNSCSVVGFNLHHCTQEIKELFIIVSSM